MFPSSFYKVFFKLLSCPIIDGGTRIFLRRRSRRKQYRAKVFLRSRIQRTVNFLRHRSYNSFYSRYFRFRKLGLRKRYRHFFFGTRFFFQPPLDLHLFLEKAPLRRWWLRRVKGRFSSRLFKRRGKGLLLSRFNTKHSRYSFKTRQICFRRRSSKKSRGFLRRYRLFRFSGFMFPKISFITHRFKRHSAMLKLRFFRSLLKTRRLATSRFFYLGYKRLFLYKLLYFLKKRRRRLMRRRLRSRRYRFDHVLRRFSTFSFFGLRRKKRRHI